MLFTAPIPFEEAIRDRALRSVLPTSLSSRELQALAAEVKRRAMFSARTTDAGYLQQVNDVVTRIIDGKMDSASARLELKQALQALGYQPDPEKRGGLQDLSSDVRLNLVLETNVELGQGYGYWRQGQDPEVLVAFPAQELVRVVSPRGAPRDWADRWRQAGGSFYDGGRMIALKNDAVWDELGSPLNFDDALGNPYPPFAFNSGMDVVDVSRRTAIELGVMEPDEQVDPQTRLFNDGLQAAAPADFAEELLRSLGEGYELVDGVLRLIKG